MRFAAHLSFTLLALAPVCAIGQTLSAEHSAFLQVVAKAPALAAARQRADAARERVGAAGKVSDLQLEGMGSRMVGPMNERATMWEVTVSQPLPRRGERAADRERARAGVGMADADFAVMAGEMSAETAMAIAEAEGAQARARLLATQLARLDAVQRAVETRLAAGSGRLADKLTVQSRQAAMQLMVEEEERMAADALAEARGRLGLAPETPLPAFAAPGATDVSEEQAAAVRLAEARAAEAEAMVKMARASSNPMTSVGVRFEQERRAMGDDNTLGLALMTDLPWRSRRYARAEKRAAEAERAAAQTDAMAVRHRITAALARVERAERLAQVARRFSQETLGRVNAEYDAMIRSAGVGSGMGGASTVFEVVELLEKGTDTELQVIRADTAVRVARAELWRYVPAATFSNLKP